MKIAVVEDEAKLRKTLKEGLEAEGYLVDTFATGEAFEHALAESTTLYTLLILDLMLPGKLGGEVCRDLRKRGFVLPVLVLTARGTTSDKVELFDAGADDYLTKPFAFEELLARIQALLRRPREIRRDKLSVRDIELEANARTARRAGRSLLLTATEFDLLRLLLEHRGHVLSRDSICNYLWNIEGCETGNVVDVHISNLRKKIARNDEQEIIQTIRGAGYLVQE
jgi:DNA-binding response OmpR family regulator